MKNLNNNVFWGTLALLVAGILGGLAPIGAKVALQELPPLTVLFVRLTIMLLVLFPLAISSLPHMLVHWRKLFFLGLFWSGNVVLFILGITYTTAVASQILYAGVPIIVLTEQVLIVKQRLSMYQLIGIGVGFLGTLLLVVQSGNATAFGSWYGNAIIFFAACCWSLYISFSKRFSEHLTPIGLTSGAAMVAWIISGVFMLVTEGMTGMQKLFFVSLTGWEAILFLGLIIGVMMIFLYQYGIRHGSALAASVTVYISTFTAGVVGFLWFGERVTTQVLFGGTLILIGVYFTSIQPLLTKRKST